MSTHRLAHGFRAGHHVGERFPHFLPLPGFQSAIRIHPQSLRRDDTSHPLQQRHHFVNRRYPWRVNIIHTRTDLVGITEITEPSEQIHIAATGFQRNHIGIQTGDIGHDVAEFGITHMRPGHRKTRS